MTEDRSRYEGVLQVFEGRLAVRRLFECSSLASKLYYRPHYLGEVLDKVAVKVVKTYKGLGLFEVHWDLLILNCTHFIRVYSKAGG